MFRRVEPRRYLEINLVGMNCSVSVVSESNNDLDALQSAAKSLFTFIKEGSG